MSWRHLGKYIVGGLIAVFFIGIAIPKLTVRDLVPVDGARGRCAKVAIDRQFENLNLWERIAVFLGKSRITATTPTYAEMESFTFFRVPLGVLRGQPGMKTVLFCDFAEDTAQLPLPENLPSGWYAHRLSGASFIVTRQERLPEIGATEGYAYGEQVSASFAVTTLTPQAWAAEEQWLDDPTLVISKTWTETYGHPTLDVVHRTEADPQRTKYLFVGDRVYTVANYPEKGAGLGICNDLIEAYAAE